MKPNFALNLTHESIVLLHRTARGWLEVGSAALDDPDLGEALTYLRRSALGLAPHGVATKLIIPNSQILYTEVPAPGPDVDARFAQIRRALEGRTPYAVDDLVFDWSGDGPVVQVAVVARETLEEAEGFASQYRFNPVSFAAIPEGGDFAGEPFFGPTAAAAELLQPGEVIERDEVSVQVTTRGPAREGAKTARNPAPAAASVAEQVEDAVKAAPVEAAPLPVEPEPPAPAAEAVAADWRAEPDPFLPDAAQPLSEAEADDWTAEAAPEPEPQVTAATEVEAGVASEPAHEPLPEPVAESAAAEPEPEPAPPPPPPRQPDLFAAPAPTPPPAPAPARPVRAKPQPAVEVPPADATQPTAPIPALADALAAALREGPMQVTDPTVEDDLPPAIPPALLARRQAATGQPGAAPTPSVLALDLPGETEGETDEGALPFATRRAATAPAKPAARAALRANRQPLAPAQRETAAPPSAAGKSGAEAASRAARAAAAGGAKALGALVSGSGAALSTLRKRRDKERPATATATAAQAQAAAQAGGLSAKAASGLGPTDFRPRPMPRRGAPAWLFPALVGLLLLALAAVAAWSAYLTLLSPEDPAVAVAAIKPAAEGTAPAPDPAPTDGAAAEDLAVADVAVEDEAAADGIDLAALPAEAAAETPADTMEATTDGPPPAAPGAAAATASAPATARTNQDETLLANADQPAVIPDPLAPPAASAAADAAPPAPAPPPPFGTVLQFDERGLVVPTPEGVVTPQGYRVIAGKPDPAPPPRPQSVIDAAAARAAETAAPAEAAPTEAAPAAVAPAEVNPAAPDAQPAPDVEGAAPMPPADPALANVKPKPRPEGLVPAEVLQAATAEAETIVTDIPPEARMTTRRPQPRPASVTQLAAAARLSTANASLSAPAADVAAEPQDEAETAATAIPDGPISPLAVAITSRPKARPADFTRAVESAVSAAVQEALAMPVPEPVAPEPAVIVTPAPPPAAIPIAAAPPPRAAPQPEPEPVAAAPARRKPSASPEPTIFRSPEADDEPEAPASNRASPQSGTVAGNATFRNAINLRQTNLIGIYGTASKRHALVRLGSGQYKKVKVGDRLDGGTVAAITDTELRYQKGGRMLALKMPRS